MSSHCSVTIKIIWDTSHHGGKATSKAIRLSNKWIREVCTRCARGGLGLELSFNSILSSPGPFQRSGKYASPLIAPHHRPISWKGEKMAVAPTETCRLQYAVSSRHYLGGCAAGGLRMRLLVAQSPGLFKTTGTWALVLQCVTRTALPTSRCNARMCCLTIWQWASWCKLVPLWCTSP